MSPHFYKEVYAFEDSDLSVITEILKPSLFD